MLKFKKGKRFPAWSPLKHKMLWVSQVNRTFVPYLRRTYILSCKPGLRSKSGLPKLFSGGRKETMASDHLKIALAEVRAEIMATTDRLNELRRAANALERIVNPTAPSAAESEPIRLGGDRPPLRRPKTVDSVLRVLMEHPGRPMTVTVLTHRLRRQGLLDPELRQPLNTVLEAAKRLTERDDRVDRVTTSTGRTAFVFNKLESSDVEGRTTEQA